MVICLPCSSARVTHYSGHSVSNAIKFTDAQTQSVQSPAFKQSRLSLKHSNSKESENLHHMFMCAMFFKGDLHQSLHIWCCS